MESFYSFSVTNGVAETQAVAVTPSGTASNPRLYLVDPQTQAGTLLANAISLNGNVATIVIEAQYASSDYLPRDYYAIAAVGGVDERILSGRIHINPPATPESHASTHSAFGIDPISISAAQVSGLGGAAYLGVGTTSSTVAAGNDPRLSDTRVPVTHSHDDPPATLVDAKGDIIAGIGNDTLSRLPVGTAGQVLAADPSTATGLLWRPPGSTNLLTANQASIETDTTGWLTDGAKSFARSTAQARAGSASMLVTSPTQAWGVASSFVGVVAGRTYTAVASALTATGTRSQRIILQWWTDTTYISAAPTGVAVNPSSWAEVRSTGVAPATATRARIVLSPEVGTDGDAAYWDRFGLWEGAGGQWAMPGERIEGLGTWVDESVGRRIWTWDHVNARWQLTHGDTGWRDVSALCSTGTATILARRVGYFVSLVFSSWAPGSTGTKTLLTLPAGFRPDVTQRAAADDSGTLRLVYSTSDGVVAVSGVAGSSLAGAMTFSVAGAWPTALPGTAYGAIPYQ